ncbi:hypothetical protein NDU88_008029 [Pleurodeles waltl]|uniref:Uncharacterized protein n=1 Tax=Pleurodeles waltl TaxID=8319 RepID=A0AAV7N552_PLEWA|nr:hypothetical protein NDU88_008029 [Pleurodeles waltl]
MAFGEARSSQRIKIGSEHVLLVPETLLNLVHVSPAPAVDSLNTNSEENFLTKVTAKGIVEKITLIKKARTKPENNISDLMFEIKSSRGEDASSSMQEDCESGYRVGLPEDSSMSFADESTDTTDQASKGGRLFKASKKGPVKKRTSFRKLLGRPDNSNHFMDIESEIGNARCSVQEDGQSRCHQELSESLCTPYSSVNPFPIENIDMRTREGRMLKASIKEQVKQITLIKRAQKRPEKNILDHALEMKCGPGTVAACAQEDVTPRCSVEVPDNQSNTLLGVQSGNAEIAPKITGETHMLMCETEDVKKTSLARKARKRPWKDNAESVKVDEGVLSVHVSESSTTVATSENLCDTFHNVPTVAVEHVNTKMHEGHFPRAEIKGEVKKISSVKEVRKRPAKVNLGSKFEMKSEVGKDSSSMQEPTETRSSIELPESLCDAVAEIPVSSAVKLHTDIDVSHLPIAGAKGEGKIYVNPVHIRPAKNNLDHLLEIGYGDHSSSGQSDTRRYHCSGEHTEIHYSTFPADSVHRLHANADDRVLKTDKTGSAKKVTFMKKDKKKPANNTLDTPLVVGSEANDGASSLQYDVDSFPDVSTDTVDGLHSTAEDGILLNTGSKGAVKKMTLIKKDKSRLQKGDLKNVLEMKSGMGFKFSSNEKESSKSSCSFESRNNITSADVLPHHAGNLYRHIKESSILKDSKKGEVTKNTSVKNAHKRSANNSDHMLENKSTSTENTSRLQEDLRSHCNPQPSENKCHSLSEVQADASEQLNAKVGMTCMSNLSEQHTGPLVPIIKNARKMPVKTNTKYVPTEDVSLSQEAPQSQCSIKLLENLSSFPDLPSKEREHLPTISEAQMMETQGVVKKVAVMKNPRKRPEKNSDPIFDKVSGSCEAAALSKDSIKHLFGDKVPENTPNAFQCEPPHHAVHFNTNTDKDNLTQMENKGQGKQAPAVNKIRKRPAKNHLDKVPEIEIGKGENVSSVVEDSMSPGRDGFPKGLYKAISNVAAVPAKCTQVTKQEGCLFKPTAKRAVKKMTLSQKPRTGMEKDSERVLQMKSERVDDACYLVQNDSVFRYSVELPESLCSEFPATPQPVSDAMDISTDGGRLCLFTAGKKDMAKKKTLVKKTNSGPEETLSDPPHEIEIELGEDASSSVLGDSESLCGLDLAESSCSAFPDVSSDTLENVNMSTEACFLKASQKGSAGKMTLMQNTETGVEDSELDRLFAMERGGHTDALVQDDSQSSFEIEEVLDTDFTSVLPHTASTTDIGMEEDILLEDSTKENMKKGPQIKSSPSSRESHLDQECKIKCETDENLGALLHEDSESHFNVEVKDSPGLSPHTVEDVDLSTEADLLDLFQQSTNIEQGLMVTKEETGPGVSTSEPLLKRRGRKKKEPEIEVLPNGEIRVKKKPRLSAKDREGVGKPRKRGRRSESGLSNDGALDGETNLDFREIFDAVLAEASKWERMRDTEGLKHLGLGEGLSGTGALTAPPLSDNDLYSSADETEEAFFGYPHAYEHNKFTALKKQKDLMPQVEKRKTSPYFAKQFTEGERQSRDDLTGVGEDTLSGYEDASDEYLEHLLTDTDGDSEDLDLGQSSMHSYNGAGPSGLNVTPSPGSTLPGLEVNCKTVEGAILKTEQKHLSVVKNINEHLRRMERHLANLVKFNRLYIRRSLGLTGELVRENASQSLSLQRIAETLESAIPFPTASGVRITAEVAPSSASSSISSDSSDEEWAKRPSKTPKRAKRSREDGTVKKRKKK